MREESTKFLLALLVAFVMMLVFRALVFTIYYVEDSSLKPAFIGGDHVMVNRWSYGLRTGDNKLFPYGRICRQQPKRGDYIAFDDSLGHVFISKCTALPGDTVGTFIVPSTKGCYDADYYLTERYGFVSESRIIGRACIILYSHDPAYPFWDGYLESRFMLIR
ncbi:MAG: signal peptidase I [Prevotella sp.]|nr:signal peptidase I [Prevotella sp.]